MCSEGDVAHLIDDARRGEPTLVVFRADDPYREPLLGMPTPLLIQEAWHRSTEAWLRDGWQWRMRDDAFDAANKPADVDYVRVRVGRGWQR